MSRINNRFEPILPSAASSYCQVKHLKPCPDYAGWVPQAKVTPTHVLSKSAVRWSIHTLGAQRLHPTLVMYLYLRKEHRAGRLAEASARSEEILSLIRMPGNPAKPYYFPLIDRGAREGNLLSTFWRAKNISGSWSPGSIYRQKRGGWLGLAAGGYTMPDDHVTKAFEEIVFETPVPALAMGAYFLRNDGFVISGNPGPSDLVDALRAKFDYPADTDQEFTRLFHADAPAGIEFEWFELSPLPIQNGEEAADV